MYRTLLLCCLCALATAGYGQSPQVEWIKSYGGNGSEGDPGGYCFAKDGNILIANSTSSNTGDITDNNPFGGRGWLLKLNRQGGIIRSKCFGGIFAYDTIKKCATNSRTMVATDDGGYVVAFESDCGNWPLQGSPFPYGCYDSAHDYRSSILVKFDSLTHVQWAHCYGGRNSDGIRSMDKTSDGGYIFIANTRGNDGDVGFHYGDVFSSDAWLVKVDSVGNIQWKKVLGGTGIDHPRKIKEISPGRYLASIYSQSSDGDLTGLGTTDGGAWVCIIDSVGKIIKQTFTNGSFWKDLVDFTSTRDGGYILAGSCRGLIGYPAIPQCSCSDYNYSDFVIVKLDSNLNLQWCHTEGNNENHDQLYSIAALNDSEYAMSGYSGSQDYHPNGVSCKILPNPDYQAWMLSISDAGIIKWRKCISNTGGVGLYQCLTDNHTGDAFIIGAAAPIDGDFTGVKYHGGEDVILLKLGIITGIIDQTSDLYGIRLYPNPTMGRIHIAIEDAPHNTLIQICDMLGQPVAHSYLQHGDAEVDLSNMPNGFYCLMVETEDIAIHRQIIKY